MATYPSTTVTNAKYYHQLSSSDCAATCLCMCMQVSPTTAQSEYPNLYNGSAGVEWGLLAEKYGNTWHGLYTNIALSDIYNKLSNNIPVIVKVNNTVSGQHWVVIIGSIATNTLSNSSFMCLDPYTSGTPINVTNCTNYAGIYKYGYIS